MKLTPILVASLLMLPALVRSDDTATCVASGTCAADSTAASPSTQPTKWTAYGEPMKLSDAENLSAGKVLADVAKYDGKTVRLIGNVTGVCEKKGCWLKMSSEGSSSEIFVKFTCPIKGRLIPTEAVSKQVIVEGVLTVETISEDEAKHNAEDAGKTEAEVEAIKGEQTQISIKGPSALVAAD